MYAAHATTMAEALRPSRPATHWLYGTALVVAGSALIALASQISIMLPFSPVPVTGQTFAVLLIGALFGARRGALAVVAYLLEGAAGLPVLAGGAFGPIHFVGPTGGYLIGFILGAFVTGLLAERGWDRKPLTAAAAMTLGSACIFACGLAWLAPFTGWYNVLALGLLPFLPGMIVKIALATLLLPVGWKLLGTCKPNSDSTCAK